jgi:hypothetical protein
MNSAFDEGHDPLSAGMMTIIAVISLIKGKAGTILLGTSLRAERRS